MPRVIHFEIHSDEPDKVGDFYTKVFGWTISKKSAGKDDYWLIWTGRSDDKGINGGMKKRLKKGPLVTIPTVDVPSIEEYAEKVTANGGKITSPKITLKGTGFLMYCEDSEGHPFSLMQRDPHSK